MNNKTPKMSKGKILVCILVVFLLTACSPSQPAPEVSENEPVVVDQEPAQIQEPPADGVVWMEDMIYPGAEFLLEVDGFGGPMTPWRFYAVPDASSEEVAEFYKQQLNWFVVEYEETIDGFRFLMLAHPEGMAFLSDADDFNEMQEISKTMDGYLLGVEVTHSDVGAGLNRLGMAIDMHGIADQIPPNTTILVLDYYQNVY